MAKVKSAKQLLAVTENKTGMLAEVTSAIAKEKVNIQAISAYTLDGQACFRVLTDNNQKAKQALQAKGYQVSEQDAVILELPNRVGVLKEVADKLKDKGIDLKYIYGTTCSGSCDCPLVFASNNDAQAITILKG